MPFGKNASNRIAVKLLLFILSIFGFSQAAQAQTDNLMIVKYVDWDSGSGVGIVVWNPTLNPINLANYEFRIYGNGSNTATTTSQLSGTLQPCATILIGNDEYRNTNCRNSVSGSSFAAFGPGVNGNDIVAITTTSGQLIDAVGRIGYDAGNNSSQKVNNVTNALYQNTLERTPGNLVRYSLTSGQYNPNATNTATIWPNNKTTNVTGWVVSNSNCLTNSWASTMPTVDAGVGFSALCRNYVIPLNGFATSHNVTVRWSGGKGTFSNPNNIITTYTPSPQDHYQIKLTLTAMNGCHQVSDDVVVFNGDSTLNFNSLTYIPANPNVGDTVRFTLQSAGSNPRLAAHFNYGDGTAPEVKVLQAKHVYNSTGTYNVAVTNLWCPSDTLYTVVKIVEKAPVLPVTIFIPNIFTPNNDNRNDFYDPQLPATSSYLLKVYNRWGMLVFESNDQENDWDGKNVSDGVYFVHLKATLETGEILNKRLPVTIVR